MIWDCLDFLLHLVIVDTKDQIRRSGENAFVVYAKMEESGAEKQNDPTGKHG